MKKKKIKTIVFAPKDKVTRDSYQLVKILFNVEGALITNESMLEDFLDFGGNERFLKKEREKFMEQIADEFGVVVPEILEGETRVWRVVELICEKQKEYVSSLIKNKFKKERMMS